MSGRSVAESYTSAAAVTKSDTVVIRATRGIMATVTGDIAILFPDSTTIVLPAVVAGQIYPISAIKILSTGTTATGIIAFY
jgi:hypothetical protein